MIAEDYNMTNRVGMKIGEINVVASGSGGKSISSEQIAQAFAEGSNDCMNRLDYNNPYNCEKEDDLNEAYDRGCNSVWKYWVADVYRD